MWTQFLLSVSAVEGGRPSGGLHQKTGPSLTALGLWLLITHYVICPNVKEFTERYYYNNYDTIIIYHPF